MIRHRRSLTDYMNRLLSEGRAVFTAEEAEQTLGVRHRAFLDAAERLQRRGMLLQPRRGFYVIVPAQNIPLSSRGGRSSVAVHGLPERETPLSGRRASAVAAGGVCAIMR